MTVRDEWVVLLEAADEAATSPIERMDVRRLRDALDGGRQSGALYCPDRYALQVTTTGVTPIAALLDVVARWNDAVRTLALPVWPLVRVEVFTPEEIFGEGGSESDERVMSWAQGCEVLPTGDPVSEELLSRALSDPLTGLVGREVFLHYLQARLARIGDAGILAIVVVELEPALRLLGPTVGMEPEELEAAAARRFGTLLRDGDFVARAGRHQYAILLERSTEKAALAVARRMLDAAEAPLTVGDRRLTVSARAGVTVSQLGDGAVAVLARAMTALSTAERAGSVAVVRA
jgi:GGDEF domain-containing protein